MISQADNGDGVPPVALKETCRIAHGRVPLLELHVARLAAGGCGTQLVGRVRERIGGALEGAAAREYARLLVVVGPDGDVRTNLDDRRSTIDVPGGPSWHLVWVTGPPDLPPHAAKPADRAPWDTAMAEARAEGCDQAILVDSDGNVIDGGTANVWLAYADRVFTPPAPPAVAGVARRLILDRGREAGVRPEVAHIRVGDLDDADEVFFSTAIAGPRAANGRGGAATARLGEWFERVLTEAP